MFVIRCSAALVADSALLQGARDHKVSGTPGGATHFCFTFVWSSNVFAMPVNHEQAKMLQNRREVFMFRAIVYHALGLINQHPGGTLMYDLSSTNRI